MERLSDSSQLSYLIRRLVTSWLLAWQAFARNGHGEADTVDVSTHDGSMSIHCEYSDSVMGLSTMYLDRSALPLDFHDLDLDQVSFQ